MTTLPMDLEFSLARSAFDERDYATAVTRFSEVLEQEPGNRLAREYLARTLYHRASLGRAIAQCEQLLQADPTDEYATLLLVRSLERRGETWRAASLRRQLAALTGDPRHLDSHTALQ